MPFFIAEMSMPPAKPQSAHVQPAPARAAPPADVTRPANPAILTAPQSGYVFHTLNLVRADKQIQRVFIGVPTAPPPPEGYPALYALDGNAVLEFLQPETLRRFQQPPVLVLIGYHTDLRFDTTRRAYDYTPPNLDGKPMPDPLTAGRQNGGAPAFLDLIGQQIRQRVAQLAPVNPAQQTLWGHSYGGLFALYVLFTRPELFSHYIAADPSLWWHNGLILQYAQRAQAVPNRHLLIQKSGAGIPQKANAAHSQVPHNAAEQLAAQLRQRGVHAEYHHYPEQTHGGLLTQSFQDYLAQIK